MGTEQFSDPSLVGQRAPHENESWWRSIHLRSHDGTAAMLAILASGAFLLT
jgi:hypothetical protein